MAALQRKEGAEEVWRAALGALLHLTTAAGRPVAAWASGLPPAAAAELLRCAERFRWCALSCEPRSACAAAALCLHHLGNTPNIDRAVMEDLG